VIEVDDEFGRVSVLTQTK